MTSFAKYSAVYRQEGLARMGTYLTFLTTIPNDCFLPAFFILQEEAFTGLHMTLRTFVPGSQNGL
jgi:hypothetical protein